MVWKKEKGCSPTQKDKASCNTLCWVYVTRLGRKGSYRGGFFEKIAGVAPISEPGSASSKIDLPLAKAESISDIGSPSAIT